MNRLTGYGTLFVVFLTLICVSVSKPCYLNDSNEFMREFINHEFLSVLGVILAITLASIVQIHFAFNNIEEKNNTQNALKESRRELKKSAYWLVALFIFGVILVVLKPIIPASEVSVAIVNSLALILILWKVLILISITSLVFAIGSRGSIDES